MLPQGSGLGEYNPSCVIKTKYLRDIKSNRIASYLTRKYRNCRAPAAASLDRTSGCTTAVLLVNESETSAGSLFVLPALS